MQTIDYGQLARDLLLDLLGRDLTQRQVSEGSGVSMTTITSILAGNATTARTYARLRAYAQKSEETMTTDTDVTIIPVEGKRDALWARYEGQTIRQDVYLYVELDTPRMSIRYDPEIGNAVTMDVWHGRTNRYRLTGIPTPEAANELMQDVLPLVRRMVAGYETHWDGSNHIGRYTTDDASQADDELTTLCKSTEYGADNRNGVDEWDAGDWTNLVSAEDLGIRAGMTDEGLEAVEEELRAQALGDGVVLYGLTYHLRWLRDKLSAEADTD